MEKMEGGWACTALARASGKPSLQFCHCLFRGQLVRGATTFGEDASQECADFSPASAARFAINTGLYHTVPRSRCCVPMRWCSFRPALGTGTRSATKRTSQNVGRRSVASARLAAWISQFISAL